MSTKEGYSKVLTGAGTDGISDAANFASDEAKLVEEGLSGLKSFSEAGLDTDFINGDDYGIIEYFADYDLLQLGEDIDNTPSRVSEYFNALLKGLDAISDEIVVDFIVCAEQPGGGYLILYRKESQSVCKMGKLEN